MCNIISNIKQNKFKDDIFIKKFPIECKKKKKKDNIGPIPMCWE